MNTTEINNQNSMHNVNDQITLIGAGLVGSLLGIVLAKYGLKVKLIEKRPDMRIETISAGRSINLAISTRGIKALDLIGMKQTILDQAIPMYARAIHDLDGSINMQPYGINDNYYINSISRSVLNKALLDKCSKSSLIETKFNQHIESIDFKDKKITCHDATLNQTFEESYKVLMACDGANSQIRNFYTYSPHFSQSIDKLDYGYKEFTIAPNADGSFRLVKNALHIWPRGNFMLIALPNIEGTFTATLFLPYEGKISFNELNSRIKVDTFFKSYFNDTLNLIENLTDAFLTSPTGHMVTVKCQPWNISNEALLLGDAAHGIIPFYGQGMNCGFEDVSFIDKLLGNSNLDSINLNTIFNNFFVERKPNCDAISDMAYDNFIEMRDKVRDPKFMFFKIFEAELEKKFKGEYFSRYSLVSFSNVPYSFAKLMGEINFNILNELAENLNDYQEIDYNLAAKLIRIKSKPLLEPYLADLANLVNDNPYGY